MLPNFVIIGAARCGTTWLAKNLMLHPQIFMPLRKELHYFDQNYDKGRAWYEEFFRGREERAVGEATPAYLYHSTVAEMIDQDLPNAKLIVCFRDPVDRAYSHYLYRMKGRDELSFDRAVEEHPRIIEEGLYAKKIEPYLQRFGKDRLLTLLYDDICSDPKHVLEQVYGYLDVDKQFRSPLQDNTINAAREKRGSPALKLLYKTMLRLRLSSVAQSIHKVAWPEKTKIPTGVREHLLRTFYNADISRLEGLLDLDLTSWKEPPSRVGQAGASAAM